MGTEKYELVSQGYSYFFSKGKKNLNAMQLNITSMFHLTLDY